MKATILVNAGDMKRAKKAMKKLAAFEAKELSTEIKKCVLDIDFRAKQKVAVASPNGGTLKRSIRFGASGNRAYNKADAKYAAYVEFGTGSKYSGDELDALDIPRDYSAQFKGKSQDRVHLPARPFLFNSAREAIPIMYKNIINKLNNILDK
ncbi:MAG: hypothetical protein Unbinned2072contig1001_24 [Prokaryotic dsDNA virus sp.]|nr:MAG: hypothetical protein Unbinned2072contig1001_24 [Prokaryotic dsDNA virus sp.]|tara:strand:+ start:2212 stop:2667 length:456 start_codon:yes stop_codon:yes gene_type:complete